MKNNSIGNDKKSEKKQHLLSLPNKSEKIIADSRENNSNNLQKFKNMNITGRLTSDAQVRTVSQDKQVVNFSVAINDSYKNKQGERIEQTTYFDCAYWISTSVAKILTKGALVELSGRVSARAWTGQDGEARAGLNFHTSQIKFYGGAGKKQSEEPATATEKKNSKSEKPKEDDDLPF